MNNYAQVTINTVKEINANGGKPNEIWNEKANALFGLGTSAAKKGCPKGAFLGLCEDGFINGISKGDYTKSKKNKMYAIKAVCLLREIPVLVNNPKELWNIVIDEDKKSNNQMEVVCELFKAGLII